jgi:hypothetical protein
MSDLVRRLRKKQAFVRHGYAYDATFGIDPECIEAAARIEALEASLAEWKALAIQWAKDNEPLYPEQDQ